MKYFKLIGLLALLPLLFVVGCNKDDEPTILDPEVVSSSPVDNAVDVAINSSIEITFTKEMNASTINSTTFTLTEGSNTVAGTVTYSNKTANFSPNDDLKFNTLYTASLSIGAKDMDGLSIAEAYTFDFTTGAFVDITVPTVTGTNPAANATGVARNKVISITFSEEMSSASITTTSFLLAQGSNAISGSVEYSGKSARFIPNDILDADLSYQATVTTGVTDMAGNAIATAKVWSFTAGSQSGLSAVNLGTAANYVILAKTAINNSPTSAITGHLGLSPAATSFITGFGLTDATGYATSPQITGKVYAADMVSPTSSNLTTAVENMITAYNDAAGRPTPDFSELGTGNIGGMTLEPGLYKWTNTVTMPSDITISGTADDVWIFQIAGDLTMSSAIQITLTGGAQARNIFWQVAGEAVLGTTSHFEGVILSMTGITLQTGASLNGRMLAQTTVILDANAVTKP